MYALTKEPVLTWYEYKDYSNPNWRQLIKAVSILDADAQMKALGFNTIKLAVESGVRFLLHDSSSQKTVIVQKVKGMVVEYRVAGPDAYRSDLYPNPVKALEAYRKRLDKKANCFFHDTVLIQMPTGHRHMAKSIESYRD